MNYQYYKNVIKDAAFIICYLFVTSYIVETFCKYEFSDEVVKINTKHLQFIIICLIIPIVETFLYQYLPYILLVKRLPTKFIVVLSGLLFGLSHVYSIFYFLVTLFIGLYFSYRFIKYSENFSRLISFWTITFLHFINNSIAFAYNTI